MSINLKLALPALLSIFLVFIAIQNYWQPQQLNNAREIYKKHTHEILRSAQSELTRDLLENNFSALYTSLDHLRTGHEEEWLNFVLYKGDGKRVYPLISNPEYKPEHIEDLIKIQHPLMVAGSPVGHIEFDLNWSQHRDEVLSNIIGLRNTALGLFLLAILVSTLAQFRLVYAPLKRLQETTEEIAKGDLRAEQLPAITNDEIGALTRSYRSMLDELKFQKSALDQHAIVSMTDTSGNITYVNQRFVEISGYSKEELLGKNHRIIKSHRHPDDFYQDMWKTISNGKVWHGEVCNRRKGGGDYWVNSTIVPFIGDSGIPLYYISIRTDITEHKLTENYLAHARDEAQQANRAKSDFLSSMSHELRTPMNAILGFAQVLDMEEDLAEEHKDNIQEILKAGHHLLGLINEVLDLSKIESGNIELSIEPVHLEGVITESLKLLSSISDSRNISITTENIDNYIVRSDRVRLKQILLNLLTNAIKYNKEDGTVTVSNEKLNDQTLRISVSDTGRGIAKEQQDELFQPFKRLDAENSEIEGTGIGLSITKRLVEMMGGEIGFHSTPAIGSRFWVDLILDTEEPATMDEIDSTETEKPKPLVADSQHSILYIEDNPANIRLVTRILAKEPHISLTTAHEPKLGIAIAMENTPDLILLDINLPGMDGYQVLKVLKMNDKTKNIPVIAVTANAMPRDKKRCQEAGFNDYLSKPFDVANFLSSIESLLDHTRQ